MRSHSTAQLRGAENSSNSTSASRQESVRKASLKTQDEIKTSVLKGFEVKDSEVINVFSEIDFDGESQRSRGLR